MKKSAKWSWGCMLLLIVMMAAATIVESVKGMGYGHAWVYGTWWFRLLWLVMAGTALWHIVKCRLWRRTVVGLIHLAFLMILAGAALTAITSHRGILHLREGSSSDIYADDNSRVRHLPFEARLDSFRIQYYPGTQTPQDYISDVEMGGQKYRISMNRIVRKDGFRFYQSSYDRDGMGTILRVNYDPWGTGVTYAGYLLLGLSMLAYLITGSSFWKRRKNLRTLSLWAVLLFFSGTLNASDSLPFIPKESVEQRASEQVLWQGRPAPLGTLAKDFLLKVYGKTAYKGLTPMQVLLSWQENPEHWAQEPIIVRKDKTVACLDDFMDYSVMPPRIKGVEGTPHLAEKVSLILTMTQGRLIKPLPAEVEPRSDVRIAAELFYNRFNWTLCGMIGCWLLVLVCLVCSYVPLKAVSGNQHFLGTAVSMGRLCLFLFMAVAFFLRWNAAGRVPLSNGHETLHFAALCVLAVGGLSSRLRYEAASLLPAAFLLLVAHLGEKDPGITPLMPVLHSPWLSAHVSVIMLSYALLMLSIVDRRMLRAAVCLLAAGIFLGAVWANVSWGSYWSWDPKETWALITMLVYSVPLHSQSLPWFRSMRNYRIYSLVALACLAMTYWGVNYLLGGMHSYAS